MNHLEIHKDNPQQRMIQKAIDILLGGGLIVYPTDTVYGLGCDLLNKRALEKIYQIKGNDKRALLSFICPDLKDIAQYALVSTPSYKIMRHLTPGPFTFILKASRNVPKTLLQKRKTVGIRVPDNDVSQQLLMGLGNPIISTSARLPGHEYTNDTLEIMETFQHKADLFLDSGLGGIHPSTVIDLSGDKPTIIREGKGIIDIPMGE